MHTHKRSVILLILIAILWGCTPAIAKVTDLPPIETLSPASTMQAVAPVPTIQLLRSLLTYEDLMNRRPANSPMDESALAYPSNATPGDHSFEGHLILTWDSGDGQIEHLRGELDSELQSMPSFAIDFVQSENYLIPVQRASIIPEHLGWNIIVEPGRVWQEPGDQSFSRASFPFALVVKGGNATFNGTMTFLFDDRQVSPVWYQVTQETTSYVRANMWGFYSADYQPKSVTNADEISASFADELAGRFPTKPIESLAEDYPNVDVTAFGKGVTPQHMTWYGFVINGVNYVGGCQTRFGAYPYCEYMRATSYSTAKSGFVSVALMRLAQVYDPKVTESLVKDYLPETADSPGDWEMVTFGNVIDMSTGNYRSASRMGDENSDQMGEFFVSQPYAERMSIALNWPNARQPGKQWVYRTSDTFILTRAMQNYLQAQLGTDADIFDFVVDEVYRPLGMGPGVMSSMRTADNNWNGQPEGGYGVWWIPDDMAKLNSLLVNGGQINGQQALHPNLLATALQQNPDDRGVTIDSWNMYNNAFWATRYSASDKYTCEYWVPTMQGVSGNVVALFPNGTIYYYFSDNQEFIWTAAMNESNKLIPFCE